MIKLRNICFLKMNDHYWIWLIMCTPLQLDKHAIVMKTGVNSGGDICLLPAGRETNSISFTKNELFFQWNFCISVHAGKKKHGTKSAAVYCCNRLTSWIIQSREPEVFALLFSGTKIIPRLCNDILWCCVLQSLWNFECHGANVLSRY